MTDDVLIAIDGGAGRVRLNRPRAIHALTQPMCAAMIAALQGWRDDPAIALIIVDHAEGRGFCAGGDIVAASRDAALAHAFFEEEYRLNHLLFTYPKPVVAFMDGVTMGGGVGISQPARYRVATEQTVFAMPETGIGLFPDVGGGWYLSRLPGAMGEYLALTGARLSGAETFALGLATHYMRSDGIPALKTALAARPHDIEALLAEGSSAPPEAPLLQHSEAIDRLFAVESLEAVLDALTSERSAWADATLATLRTKSPLSCKVSLRLLLDSRQRVRFEDEMRAEYGVAFHICARPDFREGVRALLVDRDNTPTWNPATPEAVSDEMVDGIFASLPAKDNWTPITW